MALPGMKLGILVLKTLAKPIAAKLKQQAGVHPRFRELIISIAQANHRISTNAQRRIYGHATDVEIHPLNEEKAVQAAVDLFGEVFIFSVGGAVVIFEVQRSSRSEARKEEVRRKELEALHLRGDELNKEMEDLKRKFAELEHIAMGRGLSGLFNFKQVLPEVVQSANPA
ncbi:unnamed protein product [Rhodiola kirilowii]